MGPCQTSCDVERQTLSSAQTFALAPPVAQDVPATQATTGAGARNTQVVVSAPTIDVSKTSTAIPGRSFEAALGSSAGSVSFSGSSGLENVHIVDGLDTSKLDFGTASSRRKAREREERRRRQLEKEASYRQAARAKKQRRLDLIARELAAHGSPVVVEARVRRLAGASRTFLQWFLLNHNPSIHL